MFQYVSYSYKKITNLGGLISLSEQKSQEYIFSWAATQEKLIPSLKLLNGSLNGVRLTIGNAVKAKRGGLKKGHPDIQWPVARGKWIGLYIELKKESGGILSPEQKAWLSDLTKEKHLAVCIHGHKKSIELIKAYSRGNVEEVEALLSE